MIRDDIKAALVSAMKSGDKAGTQTMRIICCPFRLVGKIQS